MPILNIEQPSIININESLRLRAFDGIYDFAVSFYKDKDVLHFSENKPDSSNGYNYEAVGSMYKFLSNKGELYFIEVLDGERFVPVGDVTFWEDDMPIVIGESHYRNMGIGKKVIGRLVQRARELDMKKLRIGFVYDFNIRSQRLFESFGFYPYFKKDIEIKYELMLKPDNTELSLVFPSAKYQIQYLDLIDEYSLADELIVPYSLRFNPPSFNAYLKRLLNNAKGITQPGRVPACLYWLVRNSDDKILGAVDIRYSLNEMMLKKGGHIGYGIRPSERHKGYGSALLSLALEKCRNMPLQRVLITCDKDNVASEKVILKNGGTFHSNIAESNGNVIKRFWVDL